MVAPEEIVSAAVSHSYALRLADQDITAAASQQAQSRAQTLPRLSADARATRYSGLEGTSFGPLFAIPAIDNWYGAGVGLSQPAYTGGRLKSQRESAALQRLAAKETRRGAEADLTLDALTAYWNWSMAYYGVGSLADAVARTKAHAVDMRHLHAAGLATDNDALATEVLLDQTRLRLEEAQRQVEVARARIAYLTGREVPTNGCPLKATAAGDLPLAAEPALMQTAQSNRAERAASQLQAQSAEAQVKVRRAELLPQVALTARYEQARPNLLDIPPQDRWLGDASVGVTLSWNLFDWGLTRAKVSEARARAEQARLRQHQVEDQIVLEVREARINLENARQRIRVADRVTQSAQRNLRSATDLWQNGLARHADVLDAHAQLTNAEFERLAARAELALARATLDHAVGRLRSPPPGGP